jgi:NAD(P)-dependent dehydrogenase (short-subunit alcohol dehydrogenase family)
VKLLVTGGASGIGRAVVIAMARQYPESSIGLVDRDEPGMAARARELVGLGARCITIESDLVTVDQPVAAVHTVEREFGGLDVLVSNAGVSAGGPLKDLSVEDYDTTLAVNARAAWLLAKSAYPSLVRSRGAIVMTTSISGHFPTPRAGAYSVSKAALLMLVKQLALSGDPTASVSTAYLPVPWTRR